MQLKCKQSFTNFFHDVKFGICVSIKIDHYLWLLVPEANPWDKALLRQTSWIHPRVGESFWSICVRGWQCPLFGHCSVPKCAGNPWVFCCKGRSILVPKFPKIDTRCRLIATQNQNWNFCEKSRQNKKEFLAL